jgi:hypothetical protein
MRFTERVRVWLGREAADAQELAAETRERLEDDLGRRERELVASPDERLTTLQEQIAENDAAFRALQERLQSPPAPPPTDA